MKIINSKYLLKFSTFFFLFLLGLQSHAQTGCLIYDWNGSQWMSSGQFYSTSAGAPMLDLCGAGTGVVSQYGGTATTLTAQCFSGYSETLPATYSRCYVSTVNRCGVLTTVTAIPCPIDTNIWLLMASTIIMFFFLYKKEHFAFN